MRKCEDCNLCCKLPEIPSINKKSYTWCKDCNIGVGCSIYENRPKKCKEFFCAWKIGLLPENLKPNKVGFFAFLENELSPIERVLTVYCEQYKLNNIIKFLKDVNITDKLGQAYRFVIRYNKDDNNLYIYDPKAINKLITEKDINVFNIKAR